MEYQQFENSCFAELEAKQDKIIETIMGFTKELDMEQRRIKYWHEKELFLEAAIIPIGSWGAQSKTWLWAWANQNLDSSLRADSAGLKQLHVLTGNEEFQSKVPIPADESKAWKLTAVACHFFGGIGAWNWGDPGETTHLFFVIRELRHFVNPEVLLKRAQAVAEFYLKSGELEKDPVSFADITSQVAPFEHRSRYMADEARTINVLRKRFPEIRFNMLDADLRGKVLPWVHDLHVQEMVDWGYVATNRPINLAGANLSGSRFDGAIMRGAALSDASFAECSLVGADLSGADLRGTSFRNAFLNGVNFTRAGLAGADFSGAELSRTLLNNVDLSEVKGLDQVRHLAPSEVSMSTLIASHFEISPTFLRKAGVSRGLIEDLMRGKRFSNTYQTCFISYSSKDEVFAERLYNSLIAAEVRVFWDHYDVLPGENLETQIYEAINEHDRLLVILSGDSMKSKWVAREIELAWLHKKESLVPVRLCPIEDIRNWTEEQAQLPKLAELFPILDFSKWNYPEEYDHAFALILKSLSGGVDFRSNKNSHKKT